MAEPRANRVSPRHERTIQYLRQLLGPVDVGVPKSGDDGDAMAVSELFRPFITLEVGGKLRVFEPNTDDRITIGTHPECEVTLDSQRVSRKHAMILYDRPKGWWILQDLGSRTGVALNNIQVERAFLNTGDMISIGGELIRVSDMGEVGGR